MNSEKKIYGCCTVHVSRLEPFRRRSMKPPNSVHKNSGMRYMARKTVKWAAQHRLETIIPTKEATLIKVKRFYREHPIGRACDQGKLTKRHASQASQPVHSGLCGRKPARFEVTSRQSVARKIRLNDVLECLDNDQNFIDSRQEVPEEQTETETETLDDCFSLRPGSKLHVTIFLDVIYSYF